MAEESFLAQSLSTLITDFNRRSLQYALAGGWAYSALVELRATADIDILLLMEQPSRDLVSFRFNHYVSCCNGFPRDFDLVMCGYSEKSGSGD